MIDFKKELNPVQLEAVNYLEGPLLIVAGAGSGKTRVLTYRIANLLANGISPEKILAITFTNKAANEMKERVQNLIGDEAKYIQMRTFHSFGAWFLRQEIERADWKTYGRNFTIFDTDDGKKVIETCLEKLNLSKDQYVPKELMNQISNLKNELITPENFAQQMGLVNNFQKNLAQIYEMYEKLLQENRAVDFDDLLKIPVEILQTNAQIREYYQQRFSYILIDEYQDTNHAQYELVRLLAKSHKNLCVVGDADQSIYGWRGADMQNILDFERDYPQAKVIKLEENYRSTKYILEAANAVIAHNLNRKPKNLWTRKKDGEKITLYAASDENDEANFIVREILKKKNFGDVAILYRMNALSKKIEDAFIRAGIPYTIIKGLKFYDRKEIKDIIAYLHVLYNPHDNINFKRIINEPARGIGAKTVEVLEEYGELHHKSLFEVLSSPKSLDNIAGLKPKAKKSCLALIEILFSLLMAQNSLPLPEFIDKILQDTGYFNSLNEDSEEDQSRKENLLKFIQTAEEFLEKIENDGEEHDDVLNEFLQHIALTKAMDQTDFAGDCVTLMTLHAVKGLEFPTVFLIAMEENILPSARSMSSFSLDEIEEERRLCYVGMTRAQTNLYLTYAKLRAPFFDRRFYELSRTTPSRFLDEIPKDCYVKLTRQPVFQSYVQKKNALAAQQSSHESSSLLSRMMKSLFSSEKPKETKSKQTPLRPNMSVVWKVGDRVWHPKFGEGRIVSIKGSGEETELIIAFPNQGIKSLMQQYAPIKKL